MMNCRQITMHHQSLCIEERIYEMFPFPVFLMSTGVTTQRELYPFIMLVIVIF